MRKSIAVAIPLLFALPASAAEVGTSLDDAMPGLTHAQVQTRAALIHATWDLPSEALDRIPGVPQTDAERLEAELPSLVNPANGNLMLPFDDLRLGANGPAAEIVRVYNTLDPNAGDFGAGWSWSFGMRLEAADGVMLLHDDDGGIMTFTASPDGKTFRETSVGQEIAARGDGGWMRTMIESGEADRFDRDGRLVERLNADGRSLKVQRDEKGRVKRIVASNGRTLSIETNGAGRIVSIKDEAGRVATYRYEDDRLAESDLDGLVTKYRYDESSRLVAVTFPRGEAMGIRYDEALDKVSEVTIGSRKLTAAFGGDETMHKADLTIDGEAAHFTYDESAGLAKVEYPDGSKEVRHFDTDCGCLTDVAQGDSTDHLAYDDHGRIERFDGPAGAVHYEYGAKALSKMEIRPGDPTGLVLTFDDAGNVLTMAGDGHQVEIAYENGLPTKVRRDGKITGSYLYDKQEDIVGVKDADGRVTKIEYDAAGMVTAIVREDHVRIEFARKSGSFVPEVRLSLRTTSGTRGAILDQDDMEWLYGDLATGPVKKASLDSIPGAKYAALDGAPIAALSAPVLGEAICIGRRCAAVLAARCLTALLLDTVSPIGSPLYFDETTGELKLDLKKWATDETVGELKDALKEAGKKKSEGFLRKVWNKASSVVKKASKVVWKYAKKLVKPIKIVMALFDAIHCIKDANAIANGITGCPVSSMPGGP